MKPETVFSALAVLLAVAAMAYTVYTAREDRNAALVSIGVAVLRADPGKEPQVTGAREWALQLIDANAGGVKFSPQARAALLQQRLGFVPDTTDTFSSTPRCSVLKDGVWIPEPCPKISK
jgi:hypothetical protein